YRLLAYVKVGTSSLPVRRRRSAQQRVLRAPMVMRKLEDPFGLKMDVWADEVIDEAILSRGTVAHNHLVGLTGRYTVFSNPFKRQGQFDYSSLIDNHFPLHGAV